MARRRRTPGRDSRGRFTKGHGFFSRIGKHLSMRRTEKAKREAVARRHAQLEQLRAQWQEKYPNWKPPQHIMN